MFNSPFSYSCILYFKAWCNSCEWLSALFLSIPVDSLLVPVLSELTE